MRTGEVFALTWDDVDLENRIIKINKTAYAKDKEEKGRWYLGTTKTIGSLREVYICDTLYKILLDYKKIKDDYKKQYGNNYKKYVLEEVKNKYGKLVEYRIVERCWEPFIKQGQKKIQLSKATYEGLLKVTNRDKFYRTLTEGIGKKKAYGFGLMTVIPI